MIERRSLFKYFSEEKYADAFRDGQLLFRALSYFRDFEDRQVRGDESEGQSKYRPATGLVIHNETHKTSFVLEGFSFASAVRQDEIFIFCLSMDHGQRFYDAFGAVACVEVTDVSTFCKRVQSALPDNATSPDVEPNRPRLGHRVGITMTLKAEVRAGPSRAQSPFQSCVNTRGSKSFAWHSVSPTHLTFRTLKRVSSMTITAKRGT